ncbi:MAG TPA: hypothetical protein VMG82_25430 [Candidatus Sulfotelmatobacter sp.]|nr:hypothetical protein [Candidatus Sulfotelmatobacter sp.]
MKRFAVIAASMLCLALPALGEDVTINFTGVANTSVQTLGAYAGYYTGTVTANGVTTTESPGFICDDYNNEIFLPSESWQANATSFASLLTPSVLGNTFFGNSIGLAGYAAIAYLSNLMATTPASGQADISAAIWYIGSLGTGTVSFSSLDAGAQAYVNQLLGNSTSAGLYDGTDGFTSASVFTSAAASELAGSSLWLYTPTGLDINPSSDPMPQEFVGNVPVPEGGAALLYLLLAGFACFGAMFIRARRPNTLTEMA